jgi:DNA-binding MarR family transcriptional regulator
MCVDAAGLGAVPHERGSLPMSNELARKLYDVADRDAAIVFKLEEFLPNRLSICATHVSVALSRIYAEHYKIGLSEWRVLATLGQFGTMTGKAIGNRSTMHKTKVSRAVATLQERKLLTRRANRADLREAFLTLTPAGRAIYEQATPIALDFARRLMDAIDPSDRGVLIRALSKLTDQAEKLSVDLAKSAPRR